jgi:DNA-3-methyladenine glycosylase
MVLRLDRAFFTRDTLTVARELLGARLVRVVDGRRIAGRVVEAEAYVGEGDQASHARFGPTARNAPMYGPPGHAYVYLIYGMYNCLNAVTDTEGLPAAVLLRALEPVEGVKSMRDARGEVSDTLLTSGPGRLCQALGVTRALDGVDLCRREAELFFEEDVTLPDEAIVAVPRVGVTGGAGARSAPWRFCVKGSPHLSRAPG